jgi:ATP synthase F1 complex assembly factor 2
MKAAAKRFYDKVAIRALAAGEFTVTLDGKDILTPAKRVLACKSEALAIGIALEWEKQQQHLRPDTMPLMKLATTSIDQVPTIRKTMVDSMLRCLESDLACFRSAEEPALASKEEETYGPMLNWAASELGLHLTVSDTFILEHPPAARPRAEQLLREADDWQIAALDQISSSSKSVVIALAVAHNQIDAAEAAAAARVAEIHQIQEWGEVEAGHDLDAADVAVRIGAGAFFLRCLDTGA